MISDEIEEVALDESKPDQKVKVGNTLPKQIKRQLIKLLKQYKDVFAWGPEDMPGISPQLMTLQVDPKIRPVLQAYEELVLMEQQYDSNRDELARARVGEARAKHTLL